MGALPVAAQIAAVASRDSALAAVAQERVRSGEYAGLVIGTIDHGHISKRVFGASGTTRQLDDRSLFEIGSITKVFTSLLLEDMVRRHELRLDDSVAAFLPATVKVPRRGRAITLLDLAEQHSGLPRQPDNMQPADTGNPYADYSVAQLYDFLNRYQLPRDVGAQFEYSNVGVGLLGHALSLRGGKSWEELVVTRLLTPLRMNDTRVTITSRLLAQRTVGHDERGQPAEAWDLPTLVGAGGLRSTLADMVTFLQASLDSDAPLHDLLVDAQQPRREVREAMAIGLNWFTQRRPDLSIVWHNGGTGGYRSFIGIDRANGRGIVILTNSSGNPDDLARHWLDPTIPLAAPSQP